MSESEGSDEKGQGDAGQERLRRTAPTEARSRQSWWPGWIWAIPIAAIGIVGWLLFRHIAEHGTDITITFADIYDIDPKNTNIEYRGMAIGSVTEVSLTEDGNGVRVSANIQKSATRFLKAGTVFWLKGANPSLGDLSTIGSILSGPKLVMRPGGGSSTDHFNGLTREPLPADRGTPVLFKVSFDGAVGNLSEGDPVKIRGFTVGEIKDLDFYYDAQTDAIATPLTLALYPGLFHIANATETNEASALKAALGRLVAQGLRAKLEQAPALIGSYQVTLAMMPQAPPAHLNLSENPPEIPTEPSGGLNSLLSQIQKIPLEKIANNILDITKHLDQIVSSPSLKESVKELHGSLQDIRRLIANVSPKVDQLVRTLNATAEQLDKASLSVGTAIGGPATQNGVNDTLRELKEASRAVRSLADYLERHPESLISGKSKQ